MKLEKLEALRGFAAMYVLIHHLKIGKGTLLSYITMQGQAAVMLFFVLSGFVIMYSSRKKLNYSFKEYFIKRFRRIYSVLIVALLISYIMACISQRKILGIEFVDLIFNLLNFQDMERHPGVWSEPYYGNLPLWSLTYEWWFYMLFFPIFKFVKKQRRKWLALGISITGFLTYFIWPNQLSLVLEYFIIWWWGVELAVIWIETKSFDLTRMKFIFLSFVIMIGLLAFQQWKYDGAFNMSFHPFIEIRHFIYAMALLCMGLLWRKFHYVGYDYFIKPFIYFAPISYGIYVFHYPLMMKYNLELFSNLYIQYIVGFVVTLLLAYLVEVKWQARINFWSNKFIK